MAFPPYAEPYRGEWACPCQLIWLPVYERALRYFDVIGPAEVVDYAQLIGGFSGSGGTHGDLDSRGNFTRGGGAADIWITGPRADRAVWVARQMGADATWRRLAGWDGPGSDEHIHSVLRDCPHLTQSAVAQILAVDSGGDGLGGTSIPDPGPRPLSKRTWREGIQWFTQQEDDMADAATQDLLNRILNKASAAAAGIEALKGAEADRAVATRKRDLAIAEGLDKLAESIQTRAGKDQVRKLKELVIEHDTPEATP
jgi:hypothetical protein